MTEESSGQPPEPTGTGDEFTPITSQEAFDAALKSRLARERAKFADYDEIKAKAEKFDAVEEASKSEVTKAAEARAAAEKARDDAVAEGLRYKIAAKHGISDEDAELFLTGRDEDTLTAQAKRLADREADRKRNGARSSKEGRTPSTGGDEMRDFARNLFARS